MNNTNQPKNQDSTTENKETVLAIPRTSIEETLPHQGYLDNTGPIQKILSSKNWGFLPRKTIEDDPSQKQIIPYCIVLQEGKILLYERGKSGGEQKLHSKKSIGIGGHINPQDQAPTGWKTLEKALLRELQEELHLPGKPNIQYKGIINDETNPVGQVHLGVVAVAHIQNGQIQPAEPSISNLTMITTSQLQHHIPQLETWSKIAAENIHKILQNHFPTPKQNPLFHNEQFQNQWEKALQNHKNKFLEAIQNFGGTLALCNPNNPQGYFHIQHNNRVFLLPFQALAQHEKLQKLSRKNRMQTIHKITENLLHYDKDISYSTIQRKISEEKNFESKNDPSFNQILFSIITDFLREEGFRFHMD